MKNTILVIAILFSAFTINAQNLMGSWESTTKNKEGREIKVSVIFTDKFQVATWYDAKTGAFIGTNGGSYSLDGNMLTETVEFDTENPEKVGTSVTFEIALKDDSLMAVGNNNKLTRVDNGTPGDLQGAWLMSGRKRDGEIQSRSTDRPRKTMKILSGTRFQWIAYNTETKQFMGTGGGTYTTINGKYTENIEFFSRDDSRVGASLEFDYELKDGHWHHSGFSSKGAPLYEIWSSRQK